MKFHITIHRYLLTLLLTVAALMVHAETGV